MNARRALPVWKPLHIRALRLHCGMSQDQLADWLGVRQATISNWERDVYRPRRSNRRILTRLAEQARFPLELVQ